MRFTVLWKPLAEDRLIEIWLEAEDRVAITEATARIDRLLREQPQRQGGSRDENSRVLIVPPLVVAFEIQPEDRIVSVLSVRHTKPRR